MEAVRCRIGIWTGTLILGVALFGIVMPSQGSEVQPQNAVSPDTIASTETPDTAQPTEEPPPKIQRPRTHTFSESERYPSRSARRARLRETGVTTPAVGKHAGRDSVTWHTGVEVGTTGSAYVLHQKSRTLHTLLFDTRFLALSMGGEVAPNRLVGLRAGLMMAELDGGDIRDVVLMGEWTALPVGAGTLFRIGAGLTDYASSGRNGTGTSTGMALAFAVGQIFPLTARASATIMAEVWGAAYDNDAKAGTVKVLVGLLWK